MLRSIGKQSGESVESVLKKKTKEGFAEKKPYLLYWSAERVGRQISRELGELPRRRASVVNWRLTPRAHQRSREDGRCPGCEPPPADSPRTIHHTTSAHPANQSPHLRLSEQHTCVHATTFRNHRGAISLPFSHFHFGALWLQTYAAP